jgi:hypothetical protein
MYPSVTAKLGNQRKARRWLVSPCSDGTMMVQASDCIGQFWPQTGKGMLGLKGGYFLHLHPAMGAKPFTFPQEFVAECMAVCPEPGGVTVLGGGVCYVENTVQVI